MHNIMMVFHHVLIRVTSLVVPAILISQKKKEGTKLKRKRENSVINKANYRNML